jgi:hypothetical protein
MEKATRRNGIPAFLIVLVFAIVLLGILNMPDRRTAGERVSDAASALPDLDKAEDQLERRTPGERLGDAVKDVGDDIRRTTNP